MKRQARQAARSAGWWAVAVVAVAAGAGLLTASGLAALTEAGMSRPLSLLIVGSVWFGIAGICALIGSAAPARSHDAGYDARDRRTPPVAEAFTAGLAEGAAAARRNAG